MEDTIKNISDTAFWIAGFRAMESARPDAVFKDSFAAKLAGDRGLHMAEITPHSKAMAFAMTVRTSAIDRLISEAIDLGCDTVVNMAAGLDTRPYRMDIPSTLKWIEIDLPALVAYKNEELKNEIPKCRITRIAADLSESTTRNEIFQRIGSETYKAVVVTEGLIAYLKSEQAAELSTSIFNVPSFRYWIQDYSRGAMQRNRHAKDLSKMVRQTPFQFDVKEPLLFFERQGWKVKKDILILDEADRIGRSLPFMFPWTIIAKLIPRTIRRIGNRTYGYVMFEK